LSKAPALLWDDSLLWGVMAVHALKEAGLPFELLRSRDIKGGGLKDRPFLFVPGGWASNKEESLGEKGKEAVRDFVYEGGSYLGICGGAGLATQAGLGLLAVKRKPTQKRLPSFSGRISLTLVPHPIWEGIKAPYEFHAWYPSQLSWEDGVIARFLEPSKDSFTSDLCVGDMKDASWDELEKAYGINLNPWLLNNEPAAIEGNFGKGKVLLSLVHWDTPFDKKGLKVLSNIWKYLCGSLKSRPKSAPFQRESTKELRRLFLKVRNLIAVGSRNFLWYWRNPYLLLWRRGIRGLEYSTLYTMLKEIALNAHESHLEAFGKERFRLFQDRLITFLESAKRLLILERELFTHGIVSWDTTPDPEVNNLRKELFGLKRSHGGMFKELAEDLEDFLFLIYVSSS